MTILDEPRFDFMDPRDKKLILDFNQEMNRLGFDFGGQIGDGYCWGRYMLIYRRTDAKSKTVFARVYIRTKDIALRFFLNDIDKHKDFLENAPSHIKEVFIGPFGDCQHCHNEHEGKCRFRKTYTLDGRYIEKCNGYTFEFENPQKERLIDYIALFKEFFPSQRTSSAEGLNQ